MRIFGSILIAVGSVGVVLTCLFSVATIGLTIGATGMAVSGAIFVATSDIIEQMRLLAKWLNDESQNRMDAAGVFGNRDNTEIPRR